MAGPIIQNFPVVASGYTQVTIVDARKSYGYELHLLGGGGFLYYTTDPAKIARCFGSKEFASRGAPMGGSANEEFYIKPDTDDTLVAVLDF